MVAVVINPVVCQGEWWWLIVECWGGFIPCAAVVLALAFATGRRRLSAGR